MTDITRHVTRSIQQVCPIDGLAIVDPANKATWRIDFKPEATAAQKDAARAAIQAFDPASITEDALFDAAAAIAALKDTVVRQQAFIDALQREAAQRLGG